MIFCALRRGAIAALFFGVSTTAFTQTSNNIPPEITAIISAPKYAGAVWGLRAVDVETGETVSALGPDSLFFTGSVRKLFSVGLALNTLGPDHRFVTPVYRTGRIRHGDILQGDLILEASGDLTLGG